MPQMTQKFDFKLVGSFIAGTPFNVTNNSQINYKTVTITSDGRITLSCSCSSVCSTTTTANIIPRSDWTYKPLAAHDHEECNDTNGYSEEGERREEKKE
jgi:hypothetical protein